MSIFDAIQDLIGGAAEAAQGSVGDIVGGLSEIPGIQEIQDITGGATEAITSAADGATDAVTNITEPAQSAIEDITNSLGL